MMKVLCLLTMMVLINACVAKQDQTIKDTRVYNKVESLNNEFESFDEQHPSLEINRMIKGLEKMQQIIQAFFNDYSKQAASQRNPFQRQFDRRNGYFTNRFKGLSKSILEIKEELVKGIEKTVKLHKVREWRQTFDTIRSQFKSLTTFSMNLSALKAETDMNSRFAPKEDWRTNLLQVFQHSRVEKFHFQPIYPDETLSHNLYEEAKELEKQCIEIFKRYFPALLGNDESESTEEIEEFDGSIQESLRPFRKKGPGVEKSIGVLRPLDDTDISDSQSVVELDGPVRKPLQPLKKNGPIIEKSIGVLRPLDDTDISDSQSGSKPLTGLVRRRSKAVVLEYRDPVKFPSNPAVEELDGPVRKQSQSVLKPLDDAVSSESDPNYLKPVYIRTKFEWAFALKNKELTFDTVYSMTQWNSLRGGLYLLQQSIRTIETLEKDDEINDAIYDLEQYGIMVLEVLRRKHDDPKTTIRSKEVKDIINRFYAILACYSAIINQHEFNQRTNDRADMPTFQLSLPIASWSNLDQLKPVYANSEEERAFASSEKILSFDKVSKIQDKQLFIGGMLLLRNSIQQIDRLSSCDNINSKILQVRQEASNIVNNLKNMLSKEQSRDSEDVTNLVNKFGNQLTTYVTILENMA